MATPAMAPRRATVHKVLLAVIVVVLLLFGILLIVLRPPQLGRAG